MTTPQQLNLVYRSTSAKECRRRSTVLSAAGVNHHQYQQQGEFALLVLPQDAQRAQKELDDYEKENPNPKKQTQPPSRNASGWPGMFGYVAVLIAVEFLQRTGQLGRNWFESGMTSAGLIMDGQYFRTITALTLHSDLPHLVGNLVIGGIFGLFVGKHLGSGLGWLSILIAGALGNFLNASLHQPSHTSVGASTAVFAALGILAGSTWHLKRNSKTRSLARWSPLIGGAILLGYLGTGGERTDIGAHIGGFITGLALGAILGIYGQNLAKTRTAQLALGATALAMLAISWTIALT